MAEDISAASSLFGAVKLPEKKYFKIGEASILLGVKPHVLRYWETEFSQIRPYKSRTGQRLYRHRDVEALQLIQKLLYHDRYTIAGARQAIRALYENDTMTDEELLLSDEALLEIENGSLDVATPEAQLEPAAMPVVEAALAPVPVPVKEDVLALVEQKMGQIELSPELRARLENARAQLNELIVALKA